jgi:hypothetical protein
LAAGIMLGVMFGAGGYTFYYADGAAYLSNNTANLHVSHDLVGKYPAKMENGSLHAKAFMLGNFS